MFGRRKIYTEFNEINFENIIEVLRKALSVHLQNSADIDYLYRYYRGDQPVLNRRKEVRPEINNKIVENRANEIVSFKVGYLMGEPVQYVNRGDNEQIAAQVMRLNDYMLAEDKGAKDKELADWFHICGTSYRMVLPDSAVALEEDESPFEIFTLDPRFTFVVYSMALGEPALLAVRYMVKDDGTLLFSCYTKNHYYEVDGTWTLIRETPQIFGIPVIEYPANEARLGAFEIVISLLDAINMTESNRLDGVEQFIQALLLFHNVDITAEDYSALREEGAIKFKDIDPQIKAEIKYLTAEMNQAQTQTLVDNMYDTVLTICGMPNRNGGSSTSDTGAAVIMRDGWSAAEARAKDSETMFKKSEKEFLKLVLKMCRNLSDLSLRLSNLEIRFTRRNYENITEKANVLTMMLANPKIAPVLAFTHCGLFSDPQLAYRMSVEYMEQQEKKATEKEVQTNGDVSETNAQPNAEDSQDDRRNNPSSEPSGDKG